ncbi:ssDNA endonuclease and repair protein rad10 [Tieghemiomyces parasiticus]|uniref:DNA excision repair protein ERCC-1 n=1 Tax=Tieghemiomyces parasiticus TaxID=78921 RepID=A0A9W7ZMF8_9FUNG|nr:ssDNA endonuclease and repair protein rad10 [Tieghemiomyces parasiticus]
MAHSHTATLRTGQRTDGRRDLGAAATSVVKPGYPSTAAPQSDPPAAGRPSGGMPEPFEPLGSMTPRFSRTPFRRRLLLDFSPPQLYPLGLLCRIATGSSTPLPSPPIPSPLPRSLLAMSGQANRLQFAIPTAADVEAYRREQQSKSLQPAARGTTAGPVSEPASATTTNLAPAASGPTGHRPGPAVGPTALAAHAVPGPTPNAAPSATPTGPGQGLPRSTSRFSRGSSAPSARDGRVGAGAAAATTRRVGGGGAPTTHSVLVNSRQYGNPVLEHIRNVPWEYSEIVPDFAVGQTACAVFLSLKYHRLHPEYIGPRIDELRDSYVLRVLLVLVDNDDCQQAIRELTRIAVLTRMTMVLAWSTEEAGRYIETFKALENQAPDTIREKVEAGYLARLTDALTSVRSVNKTDATTLVANLGSFQAMAKATPAELAMCPGFGEQKAKRLYDAFHTPFTAGKDDA